MANKVWGSQSLQVLTVAHGKLVCLHGLLQYMIESQLVGFARTWPLRHHGLSHKRPAA
ncbi:hypothetical protein Mal52_13660 [Symmachiella dynata]|uniref:Uncharacterized protein n=1 Tax=Symmachiella dynata TaxID=2527995 RepID=A0A517ZKB6_9PLAN|nr:hypothetical protein [Symmachiella dynata]QDU42897.1 hypothetical protein Mal52_13660 [Symmachiella dynata]